MISFSKTTEYAFRIMSHFAQNENKLYKSDEVYEELQIPFRYMRRLLTHLSNEGLLTSIQGKFGGYKLAKKLDEINLHDIVQAIDENKKQKECFFGFEKCPLTERCSMHDKWKNVQSTINSVLESTTLKDIKEEGTDKLLKSL